MSDAREQEEKKPQRGIAILLGVFGPWGIGHFYLGQTRRALAWLLLSAVALVLFALLLQPLGEVVGYGKMLAVLVCSIPLAWVASLLDLLAVPEARMASVRKLAVVGFWLAGFVLTLALRGAIRGYVLEAYKIPSGAMQPVLLVGEHIMVDKLALRSRAPKRGEMIVFKFPERTDQDYVKRVIALPGDTLEIKRGHPWLNGWEVPHCAIGKAMVPDAEPGCSGTLELEFLDGETYLVFFDDCAASDKDQGPYHAAVDQVWVLGDNRNRSFDSPAWLGGRGSGVPFDHVRGRALFRWYSSAEWSRYGVPLTDPLLPDSMADLRRGLEKCLASRPPREKTLPPGPLSP
jgi:signal peptidase I